MNTELGLTFEPQKMKFKEMLVGLQSLIKKKENGIFFLDASAECEMKFSSSFVGPSNKMSGWVINEKEVDSFVKAYNSNDLELFKNKRITVWSYWDGEYSGGWLYSFEGPIFGEVDICE